MKDLQNDMQVLVNKIKAPSIFYIPRKLVAKLSKKDRDNLTKIGFLDTMFIINTSGVNKPITNANELLNLFEKEKILTSNIFQLLVLKTKLEKATFHYLLEEYLKELVSWLGVLDVVRVDAKVDLHYYKPYFQSYLDMQYNHLKNHKTEINQKFGHWKTEFEIGRIFNDPNFKLPKRRQKENLSSNKIDNGKIAPIKGATQPAKIIKRKSKPLLISDTDADAYLLKTVFNVNFNNINVVECEK